MNALALVSSIRPRSHPGRCHPRPTAELQLECPKDQHIIAVHGHVVVRVPARILHLQRAVHLDNILANPLVALLRVRERNVLLRVTIVQLEVVNQQIA